MAWRAVAYSAGGGGSSNVRDESTATGVVELAVLSALACIVAAAAGTVAIAETIRRLR